MKMVNKERVEDYARILLRVSPAIAALIGYFVLSGMIRLAGIPMEAAENLVWSLTALNGILDFLFLAFCGLML